MRLSPLELSTVSPWVLYRKELPLALEFRDRGEGGAGRAIALPLFCLDSFLRAPEDIYILGILPLESNKRPLLLHGKAARRQLFSQAFPSYCQGSL